MTEEVLKELFKVGGLVGLLGYISFKLWNILTKRQDQADLDNKARMDAQANEIKLLRDAYNKEVLEDRLELKLLIKETLEANKKMLTSVDSFSNYIEKQNRRTEQVVDRSTKAMECLIREINLFKDGKSRIIKEAS